MGYAKYLILVIALGVCVAAPAEQRPGWTPILGETFGYGPDTPASVDLDRLEQGCPRRDCIPAIDDPVFVSAEEADFLQPDDLVLALAINGDARAYPANILNAHEIVNDTVGGEPVAVAYCPLCGSWLAFKRVMDGDTVAFGVSGLLHENDLVMYDRRTESLWQQITGEAIVGPKTGARLEQVPLTMTEWKRWRSSHPDTRVLTGPEGSDADYAGDHYAEYARSDRLLFPVKNESERLGRKDVVFGFEVGGKPLAVPASVLEERGSVIVEHEGRILEVRRADDGSVAARETVSDETYPSTRLYWFAWYTFHPNTAVATGKAD
jgi:hypothetical protein